MLSTHKQQLLDYLREVAGPDAGYIEVTIKNCQKGKAFTSDEAGLIKAARFIAQWDELNDIVHIGAAPRWRPPTGQNGRSMESDIAKAPHVWVDVDLPNAQELLDAFPVKPTMIIASGRPGHRQAYWRLDEAAPIDKGKPVMQLLAKALKGDATANYDRIMRPPGTTNRKPEANGAVVEIVHFDDRTVTLDELTAACPGEVFTPAPIPSTPRPAAPATNTNNVAPDGTEWDTTIQGLDVEECERLDRVTKDTPNQTKAKVKNHAKVKISHARTAMANAQETERGYGAMQLLGVARDIGRCLGGGLLYAEAKRMLQDFETEMGAADAEHVKNNARSIKRGLAQGSQKPWRPGRESVASAATVVSQDKAGGLRTHGDVTMVATMSESAGPGEALFMNGAIKVLAVVGTEDAGVNQAYEVELTVGGRTRTSYLETADVADGKRLKKWAIDRGIEIYRVLNAVPNGLDDVYRLNRFLLSQGAPQSKVIHTIGWNKEADAFLTMEGRITADGFEPGFNGVRPHPHMVRQHLTRHRYGTEKTVDEARDALREVLTWQHPRTSAMFGCWTVLSVLKPLMLAKKGGLVPFLAVQAPQGTGKSEGQLPTLLSLFGAPERPLAGNTTLPTFRDAVSAHNAGAIWMDDSEHVSSKLFWEYIRSSTTNAAYLKKAGDNVTSMEIPLTASIVLSGEGLKIQDDGALEERSVFIVPEDPRNRKSVHGLADQYADMQLWREHNPNPTDYAAAMVQLCLQQADLIDLLPTLTGGLPGRRGEKAAAMRLGALVLERMTESAEGTFGSFVEAWINESLQQKTRHVFEAQFLRDLLAIQEPVSFQAYEGPANGKPGSALLFDERNELWVSIQNGLAWMREKRIELRSGMDDAGVLGVQAKDAGCEWKKGKRVSGRQINVWRIPPDMAYRIGWGPDPDVSNAQMGMDG